MGRDQLTRGGPLAGYFQPVQIVGPPGSSIWLVIDGEFDRPQPAPVTVGMLIGEVYRFKVTGIPDNPGFEVFPTIEVVHRTFPPRGAKTRFPIPVHVTQEELELALAGQFVTRVIYLEDPATALVVPEERGFQRFFEVMPDQDPLRVADQLGRPMAILRMGSRMPDSLATSGRFAFGSPPLKKYDPLNRQPVARELRSVESLPLSANSENSVDETPSGEQLLEQNHDKNMRRLPLKLRRALINLLTFNPLAELSKP